MLFESCYSQNQKDLQINTHNTSISGVKSSWTILQSCVKNCSRTWPSVNDEERQHFLPLGHFWVGLCSDEVEVDAVDSRLEVASHLVQILLSARLPIVLLQPVLANLEHGHKIHISGLFCYGTNERKISKSRLMNRSCTPFVLHQKRAPKSKIQDMRPRV